MGDATSTNTSAQSNGKDNGKLSDLHQPTTFITGHNSSGQAIVQSHNPFQWRPYDDNNLAFAVPYTTSRCPPDLNNDADLKLHQSLISTPDKLGLVNPKGTVLRCVDFAPGYACGMHRTQSLDYGIVMEGEVDMVLDSGERYSLKRGDVAIQRATQHQWVNKSDTKWARMMFVLQDCEPLVVGGKKMGEDLGTNSGLPPSNN
ncbi:hypothetical protein QC763_405690 [Podospora pseudopauciseta]|uniref:Cupin type-2 domain-containing protein n=2 Tax=Podospora TaxID=5144 RepID=A0ABR0HDS0_9PEZI|nr:hypothetical protein QC763_405690 [Podospora pseudopauciseta]KAK4677386.1 hypothetical protein QC764_405690 [Podospora pseudoanserina]